MFIDTVAGGGFILEGRVGEEICMHNLTVGAASKQEENTHRGRTVSAYTLDVVTLLIRRRRANVSFCRLLIHLRSHLFSIFEPER